MNLKFNSILLITIQLFAQSNAAYYAEKVNITTVPYVALLIGPRYLCSGAIISDRHILTAAHCLPKKGRVRVTVGSELFYINKQRNPHAMVIKATKMWAHENFSLPSAVYDIGVIELPTALNFSEAVQPLKLSTKKNAEEDLDNLEVYAAGFGYNEKYYGPSDNLLYSRLKLIKLDECKKYKDFYVEDLNENHICMISIKGQPCDGDSGSAVVSVKTGEIIGIHSYGKDAENGVGIGYNDCEAITVPKVTTRVSNYIDWISEKTGINFNEKTTHLIK